MMIEILLPDEVVLRARSAGLLSDEAIRVLLEEALRKRAGRALLDVAGELKALGVPPMSEEEIEAAVTAARAGRHGGVPGADAGCS